MIIQFFTIFYMKSISGNISIFEMEIYHFIRRKEEKESGESSHKKLKREPPHAKLYGGFAHFTKEHDPTFTCNSGI